MFNIHDRVDYPEGRKRCGVITEITEEGCAILWPDMLNSTRWYREGELQPFRFVIGDKVKLVNFECNGVVVALDDVNDPIVKWDGDSRTITYFTDDLLFLIATTVAPNNFGCPHTNIREVPLGISPAAKTIWVCVDCKKEIIGKCG